MSEFTDKRDAFFAHIEAWFDRLQSRIESMFLASVDAVEKAAEENKDKIDGDISKFFEDTATNAIHAAEEAGGSWTDKLSAAVASVASEFASNGVEVAKHVVVLIVTNALSKIKAQ